MTRAKQMVGKLPSCGKGEGMAWHGMAWYGMVWQGRAT